METFQLFANPWWVNLLIAIPCVAFFAFQKRKLELSWQQLLLCFIFGIAFGFVEAAVVVYLRAALGILSSNQPVQMLGALPVNLVSIELIREAATLVILVIVAFLTTKMARERWAVFLWTFATWDLFYYIFLWLMIRWPSSLTTIDVLFLIPSPWYAQVWFPLLVDILVLGAILMRKFWPKRF